MSTAALAALYFALVALGALFAASETALFALRWWRRRSLMRHRALAPLLERLESRPARLLFALLIGSEISGILAATVVDRVRERLSGGTVWGYALAALGAGFFGAVFGELLPKVAAARRAEFLARLLARPLRAWLFFAEPLAEWLGGESAADAHGAESVRGVIGQARAAGALGVREARLVAGIEGLARIPVAAVMTPHPDVAGVELGTGAEAAAAECRRSGYTRLVVFDGPRDNWPGDLHAADLLPAAQGRWPVDALVLPAPHIPATASVRQGLDALIAAHAHVGFAVTETGQFAGLFTLEDGWRAALGERRGAPREIGPERWQCAGETPLGELPVTPDTGDIDPPPATVAGLIAELSGELPAAGQQVELDGWRYTVETASGRRATRVRIERAG